MKRISPIALAQCALFAAVIAISTFIRIPIPGLHMQFTAQVLAVLLSGLALGPVGGAVSCVVYLTIGLLGVPVFSRGGGPGTVLSFEFGFLLGFPVAAWVSGTLCARLARWRYALAPLGALVAMYAVALPYCALLARFALGKPMGFSALFGALCLPFLPLDIVKALMAGLLARKLAPAIARVNAARGNAARVNVRATRR